MKHSEKSQKIDDESKSNKESKNNRESKTDREIKIDEELEKEIIVQEILDRNIRDGMDREEELDIQINSSIDKEEILDEEILADEEIIKKNDEEKNPKKSILMQRDLDLARAEQSKISVKIKDLLDEREALETVLEKKLLEKFPRENRIRRAVIQKESQNDKDK